MKVFVAGGTGAIGRHAVPALVEAGHAVTALARTRHTARALAAQGASPVAVSLFDRPALTVAVAGHDAIVNLATAIPPMTQFLRRRAWQRNDRIRREGSATVVDAAMAAGIERVVQESVSMLYPGNGADWIDETTPADPFPIARANLAAEGNGHRFTREAGAGVVLRFGWFYGPGARHSEQLFALARQGLVVVMGRADGYVSSLHVADGGAAVAAALHAPAGGFNVVDDTPLTKREYADALATAAGRRTWIGYPGRAALAFGDRLTSLTRSLRVSNSRFRTATTWTPRHPSAYEGWQATASVLRPPSGPRD